MKLKIFIQTQSIHSFMSYASVRVAQKKSLGLFMTADKEREFWISKGRSNFCSDLIYDYESDSYVKCSPDGFYDVVSKKDTIEGGIHVIEYSAYQALKEEITRLQQELGKEVESHRETVSVLAFYASDENKFDGAYDRSEGGDFLGYVDESDFSATNSGKHYGKRARSRIGELKNESN